MFASLTVSETVNRSIAAANEYLTSLSEYKETSVFNLFRKSEKVDRVRKGKRRLRDQTTEFAGHYSVRRSSTHNVFSDDDSL